MNALHPTEELAKLKSEHSALLKVSKRLLRVSKAALPIIEGAASSAELKSTTAASIGDREAWKMLAEKYEKQAEDCRQAIGQPRRAQA
jgi:hypothetical protein